jgi:hypothetical protein
MLAPERPHYIHANRCTRRGVETVGGRDFCKQHAKLARSHPALAAMRTIKP